MGGSFGPQRRSELQRALRSQRILEALSRGAQSARQPGGRQQLMKLPQTTLDENAKQLFRQ